MILFAPNTFILHGLILHYFHCILQVIPLLDGMLAIIRGSDQCAEFIDTGVSAFSSVVAANLSPWTKGLQLVVGGADGSVLCLGDISNTSASERY